MDHSQKLSSSCTSPEAANSWQLQTLMRTVITASTTAGQFNRTPLGRSVCMRRPLAMESGF